MPLLHTDALIMRRRPTRDADALVTLFGEKGGKIVASTKSVMKTTSRLAGITQPFNQLHAILYAKSEDQEIWTLTQASLIRSFSAIQTDLNRMAFASCLVEWLDILSGEFESNQPVWQLLIASMERWERQEPGMEDLFYCQWQLLRDAGFEPQIGTCLRCRSVEASSWKYSVKEGGVLCRKCPGEGLTLSHASMLSLRKLAASPQPPSWQIAIEQKNEIHLLLDRHLEYHGGMASKASRFLDKLLEKGKTGVSNGSILREEKECRL
ncbi:MAG: DNA repair protein RecO [Candidatus Omnitrophota bacterium]